MFAKCCTSMDCHERHVDKLVTFHACSEFNINFSFYKQIFLGETIVLQFVVFFERHKEIVLQYFCYVIPWYVFDICLSITLPRNCFCRVLYFIVLCFFIEINQRNAIITCATLSPIAWQSCLFLEIYYHKMRYITTL